MSKAATPNRATSRRVLRTLRTLYAAAVKARAMGVALTSRFDSRVVQAYKWLGGPKREEVRSAFLNVGIDCDKLMQTATMQIGDLLT